MPYRRWTPQAPSNFVGSEFDFLPLSTKCRYLRLRKRAQEGRSPAGQEQEVQVYHDFLRIVLEIINCIITQGLRKNPELVYALLHRQDVFTPFQVFSHLTKKPKSRVKNIPLP